MRDDNSNNHGNDRAVNSSQKVSKLNSDIADDSDNTSASVTAIRCGWTIAESTQIAGTADGSWTF